MRSFASSVQQTSKAPASKVEPVDVPLDESSSVDLLKQALNARFASRSNALIAKYARELKIEREDEPYSTYHWTTRTHPLRNAKTLPATKPHSGCFDWIGGENKGLPAYLWDSVDWKTVPLTADNFKAGYIAVSWTWGRYQLKQNGKRLTRKTTGTRWKVPRLPLVGPKRIDLLTALKWTLREFPMARYFWVDLLCIDQEDLKKKATEISKQANIFASAKGAISYLWTLDETKLLRSMSGFGDLLRWCSHFGPAGEALNNSIVLPPTSAPEVISKEPVSNEYFQLLRGDNWFTSLWALQEIILFPAALWITGDGHYCTINGEALTTRSFATAVRLLDLVQQSRERQWKEAEKHYMASNAINSEALRTLKVEFQTDAYRRKKALNDTFEGHLDKGETPGVVVVETEQRSARQPPWIIERHHREQPFAKEIQQWSDWSFGTAALDVSISATRAAILFAGRNRSVVEGAARELALLAALKVQPHVGFLQGKVSSNFSSDLLNVILQAEGAKIFDVAHASPSPTVIHQITNDLDLSDWEAVDDASMNYLHLEDLGELYQGPSGTSVGLWTKVTPQTDEPGSVVYLQNGKKFYTRMLKSPDLFLTSMSPCMADRLNPQTSQIARTSEAVEWVNSSGWHMHGSGRLHIPKMARVQKIVKKPKMSAGTRLRLLPNGSSFEYHLENEYHIEKLSDEKSIWKTQHKALRSLGRPQFLLVPLSIRCPKGAPQSLAQSTCFIERPEVFGVALIGQESLRKDQSMTVWHKFGVYHGWGETEPLMWKDGIIVTSAPDARSMPQQRHGDCDQYVKRTQDILKTLAEGTFDIGDFEMIQHSETVDLNSTSPRLRRASHQHR